MKENIQIPGTEVFPSPTLGRGVDLSPLGKSKPIHVEDAQSALNFLQGKVLTIIEAVIVGTQQKATKDLIKGYFSDCHMHLLGIAYPDTKMMTEAEAKITGAFEESQA